MRTGIERRFIEVGMHRVNIERGAFQEGSDRSLVLKGKDGDRF
jgi:hypothetical protein